MSVILPPCSSRYFFYFRRPEARRRREHTVSCNVAGLLLLPPSFHYHSPCMPPGEVVFPAAEIALSSLTKENGGEKMVRAEGKSKVAEVSRCRRVWASAWTFLAIFIFLVAVSLQIFDLIKSESLLLGVDLIILFDAINLLRINVISSKGKIKMICTVWGSDLKSDFR